VAKYAIVSIKSNQETMESQLRKAFNRHLTATAYLSGSLDNVAVVGSYTTPTELVVRYKIDGRANVDVTLDVS
jgi:hypothetical protein